MTRNRSWVVLALAVFCGLAAAALALGSGRRSGRTATSARTSQVAVAARDLVAGTVLTAADVKLIDWPSDVLPAGYTQSMSQVEGFGLTTSVQRNEPFLAAKLAQRGSGGGLPIVIPTGMRAVSVRVDEVIGVAGFVVPGTRVDVLVALPPRSGHEQPTSHVVLQNVQTLAAGQQLQSGTDNKPQTAAVITLLVDPRQAELLNLAANEGKIQLALRNPMDVTRVVTTGATLGAILNGGSAVEPEVSAAAAGPAAAAAAAPRPRARGYWSGRARVEVYKGAAKTSTTF
jgi:pilus assembly protein CpaB